MLQQRAAVAKILNVLQFSDLHCISPFVQMELK